MKTAFGATDRIDGQAVNGYGQGYASDSSSGLDSPGHSSPRGSLSDSQLQEWPSCSGSSIALPRADVRPSPASPTC